AQRFITLFARMLEIKPKHVIPAYEDAWYYMWRERRLPSNVDPLQSRLEDKEERSRIAKIFKQGLDKVAGYVLPIQRRGADRPGWASGSWFLRSEHLFLTPGDSPMGLRLPLDSVPWVSATDYPYINAPDPMGALPPLPSREELSQGHRMPAQASRPQVAGRSLISGRGPVSEQMLERSAPATEADQPPSFLQSADKIVRTAVCIEPREGRLHIFMPPVRTTEDYLELISAVEATATELKLPVIIEGSAPPNDPG
ncbi:MAG: dehydrogenase, partial [Lacunisphaera sp.]|nr:dehydrogenase [Lacunisphaera sp.]